MGLSFGHLERCLVIARSLRSVGTDCHFAIYGNEGADWVARDDFALHLLTATDEQGRWSETDALMANLDCDCLVVDMPYEDPGYAFIEGFANRGTHCVFVDDDRFVVPRVSVYLNSSILALSRLEGESPSDTRCLLGPDWLLLSDDFYSYVEREHNGEQPIVLTFGGSDPTNLTQRVVDSMRGCESLWPSVVAVLGPGHPGRINIPEESDIQVLHRPENLIKILSGSCGVVCSGGRTMYEAWALGKPFLPIGTAAHEARAIAGFKEAGLSALGLECWESDEFLKQFDVLLEAIG